MESGIASYQHYGSTGEGGNFDTVAFRSPSITTQPHQTMEEPRHHDEYQSLEDTGIEREEEFSVNCLNRLNQYLISEYKPPKKKAKPYRFLTTINIWLGFAFCALCACPFYFCAYKLSKSVKLLNDQGDYLSARTRSHGVACCNITAILFILVSDALIVLIIYGIIKIFTG